LTGPRLSLEIHEKAASQIEDVRDWWRRNRPGSPEALREELARVFDLVTLQPGVGTPVRRYPAVRRILLPRVGYFLY
jgi:plasmid stabilization system protein ParE